MKDEANILSKKVADLIDRDEGNDSSDAEFTALALDIFEFQFRTIEPYRKLCQRLGKPPGRVHTWQDIPAVSANAFKHFSLFTGGPGCILRTFKSSGTSDIANCSRSYFSRGGLELMDLAIERNAARMLFTKGRDSLILALAPSPSYAPASIMVYGMSRLIDKYGLKGSRFLLQAGGIDAGQIAVALDDCLAQEMPVSLIGSSFGFVNLFDAFKEIGRTFALPPGSRLMHAGGYKGRSREMAPKEFIDLAVARLGLPAGRIINLLGMTELASQIYEQVSPDKKAVKDRRLSAITRFKKTPPWVRTLLVDPERAARDESSFITRTNQTGALRHFDLANVERPMVIQTDDLGEWRLPPENGDRPGGWQGGFEVLGRARTAEPKGCSISLAEFYERRSADIRSL